MCFGLCDGCGYKAELENLARKCPTFKIHYFQAPKVIDDAGIRAAVNDLKSVFYVSGPEPMVEAIGKLLKGMGVPESQVKSDYFPGYSWP